MIQRFRQSLLGQLLGMYLLFVVLVLSAGTVVNVIVQRQLRANVEAADMALAETIALETEIKVRSARTSLTTLAQLDSVRRSDRAAMTAAFQTFKAARPDIDRVYWIEPSGRMQVSVPTDVRTLGTDYSETSIFQRARGATDPLVQGGAVDRTTFNAVAILAAPVRDDDKNLLGVVATNLLLNDFSTSLRTIVEQQATQRQRLIISILDERGQLIATPERERMLQPVVDEIPGAADALAGHAASVLGAGPDDQRWLSTSVPVPELGWAVVVQRPAGTALAVVSRFNNWLLTTAVLFAVAGLLFWLMLMRRVIRPLHALTTTYRALPAAGEAQVARPLPLAQRKDEVGVLAHSLHRLEEDVQTRLRELRTLLETSNAVVGTLEPHAVIATIIREVRRLVDVQAVSVLVPGPDNALRVLASAGHAPTYERAVHILPDDALSPSAAALRDSRPVQMIAGADEPFPPIAASEGFAAVLAIPIISRHVGSVVLVVHRREAQPFNPNEVDLLLTFANYATLAWEHAVLYERSDERLQEVARENERLYRQAVQEKQTLAALMGSMSDGLVLTSVDGAVLYANPGASALLQLPHTALQSVDVRGLERRLQMLARRPDDYARALAAQAAQGQPWLLETELAGATHAIELRWFDVRDEQGLPLGRGLLLHDITRQHEVDQFKTTLLAAVGHELRTPLAAIKGHASSLLAEDVRWSPEDQRHFLQTISAEADRLAQMVTNLLDLSRFEAGLLPLHRTAWSLDELVAQALQRVTRAGTDVVVALPPDLPPVMVDGPRVEVVLRNLLANAAAYGDGRIEVTAERLAAQVEVRVRDDGPGIAPDELPHLFERFYRAQRGMQRRSGGTGLGLAIAKAFVEAHGGVIRAESGPDGTTIALTLPIAPALDDEPARIASDVVRA